MSKPKQVHFSGTGCQYQVYADYSPEYSGMYKGVTGKLTSCREPGDFYTLPVSSKKGSKPKIICLCRYHASFVADCSGLSLNDAPTEVSK